MDALASLCRRRYTASRRGDSNQVVKEIKKDRDSVRAQTLIIFPDAALDWAEPGDEATWRCGDDQYLGLGGGATLFGRVVLAGAPGSYDSLSDFAHPSIITNRQLTRPVERDGYLSYDWHVDAGDVARQVWNCGAMNIGAAKLIATWFGLPGVDELDGFLDRLATATKTERVHD